MSSFRDNITAVAAALDVAPPGTYLGMLFKLQAAHGIATDDMFAWVKSHHEIIIAALVLEKLKGEVR